MKPQQQRLERTVAPPDMLAPPDDGRLLAVVNALPALAEHRDRLTIVERAASAYASSAPIEIVTCRDDDGRELRLLCKYGANVEDAVGHRGGAEREAIVYQRVLSPLRLRPQLFGVHVDPATGQTWLFIEYLGDVLRLEKAPQPQFLCKAAAWIADFGRLNAGRTGASELAFLPRYDEGYFAVWAARTLKFASALSPMYPWLPQLCANWQNAVCLLTDAEQTIVHGEFYPHNILCAGESVFPVDWESAAISAAEIDLASLTQGWSSDVAAAAEAVYRVAAGIGQADAPEFVRRLAAARIYWALRWIGAVNAQRSAALFTSLQHAGRQLGLID